MCAVEVIAFAYDLPDRAHISVQKYQILKNGGLRRYSEERIQRDKITTIAIRND